MAKRVPARLTAAAGRRFGVTVGLAFLVLGAIAFWRGRITLAEILAVPGVLLTLAGLTIPTHLGPVERAWMKLAHLISKVTTPVAMAVIYFVVLTIVGIIRRTVGANALVQPEHQGSFWQPRPAGARQTASMERQF